VIRIRGGFPGGTNETVHAQIYRREPIWIASLTLLFGSLFLTGCSESSSATVCPKGLMKVTAPGLKRLPPSHDNDAGDAKIPDTHPDADVDANQRHRILACRKR